jgi:hypothetical protein
MMIKSVTHTERIDASGATSLLDHSSHRYSFLDDSFAEVQQTPANLISHTFLATCWHP